MSPHEEALTTSTISDIYIQKGQTDTAINLLLRAAAVGYPKFHEGNLRHV